jgi:cytochrome b
MNDGPSSGSHMAIVWDPLVRAGHWLLVVSVALAWLTRTGWGVWHERIGYVPLVLVAIRVAWGWYGPAHARFMDFVRGPTATFNYTLQMIRGRESRYLGHNPLGGWMIVVLLVMVALVAFTGWLYTTDRFWGIEWVENLHRVLANLLLVLIAIHIGGAIYASIRHRENLIAAMIHGRKRPLDER